MRSDDLRAFAQRDWDRVQRSKLEHWIHQRDTKGVGVILQVADALRTHVARFAGTNVEQERADDLKHHVRLKRRIDAASRRLNR